MGSPPSLLDTLTLPRYLINFNKSLLFNSVQSNVSSRSTLIAIMAQTTAHAPAANNNEESAGGGGSGNDEDLFGEHYFHICIYIWACVVVSSLIALSVVIFHIAVIYCQKWGCCGRSLTRWEVKRIPLKRFQKTDGDDCQDRCPICHEEFNEGRLIRQLPCNHCYHSYCVDRWLVKMSNRCPLCKQRVSISLYCPWNKMNRKKEVHGLITAEAEAEASVDESPPLPPLSTLTPHNWYGEEIMSGPSKFIIMRPGRPTRVIDVREQKKKMKAEQEARAQAKRQHDQGAASGAGLSQALRAKEEVEPLLKAGVDSSETVVLFQKCSAKEEPCLSFVSSSLEDSEQLSRSATGKPRSLEDGPVLKSDQVVFRDLASHSWCHEPHSQVKTDLAESHHHELSDAGIVLNSRSSSVVSASAKPVSSTSGTASSFGFDFPKREAQDISTSNNSTDKPPTKHRTWPENLNQAGTTNPGKHTKCLNLSTDKMVLS